MATGTCGWCGTRYQRPPSLLGKFCSKQCAYAARRKETTSVRRMCLLPGHPLAPPSGLVSQARVTLYSKLGAGRHPCHWCGEEVAWTVGQRGNLAGNLIADHLDSNPLNDDDDNLVPSCGRCNGTRGARVSDDEPYVVRTNGTRLRGIRRECLTCSAPFVAMPSPNPKKGLYCSRSCARKGAKRG